MPSSERAFYTGENISLLVPTLDHVESSSWSKWFNSQQTSQNTSHAIVVNTTEDQREFYRGMRASGRFALLIVAQGESEPIGVVSLAGIDYRQGVAAVAIVMDTEAEARVPPLASLEAMALITQHAFDVMGLQRIEAGQVYPSLKRWARLLELLGYGTEGFKRNAFARGHTRSDVAMLACLYETFVELKSARGGSFWPGSAEIMKLIRALPPRSLAELLDEAQTQALNDYRSSNPLA